MGSSRVFHTSDNSFKVVCENVKRFYLLPQNLHEIDFPPRLNTKIGHNHHIKCCLKTELLGSSEVREEKKNKSLNLRIGTKMRDDKNVPVEGKYTILMQKMFTAFVRKSVISI